MRALRTDLRSLSRAPSGVRQYRGPCLEAANEPSVSIVDVANLPIANGLSGRTRELLATAKMTGEIAVTLVTDLEALIELLKAMRLPKGGALLALTLELQ